MRSAGAEQDYSRATLRGEESAREKRMAGAEGAAGRETRPAGDDESPSGAASRRRLSSGSEELEDDDEDLCSEYVYEDEGYLADETLAAAEVQSMEQRKLPFRALTPDELWARMREILQESTELLGVDEEVAALLLRTYRWHADDLIQEWFSERSAVLKKARLPLPEDQVPSEGQASAASAAKDAGGEMFECPITTLVVPLRESSALPCGHRFSNECWRMYLEAALLEGPKNAVDKRCPSYKCGEVVRDAFWRRFVSAESFERFRDFQLRLLVERHPAFSWCPAPGCPNAVELLQEQITHTQSTILPHLLPSSSSSSSSSSFSSSSSPASLSSSTGVCGEAASSRARAGLSRAGADCPRPKTSQAALGGASESPASSGARAAARLPGGDVSCACGARFCLYCGEEPHRPVPCEFIRSWNLKNQSEADNMVWILVHTKNCPRCRQPIEKNQGCMHMTCRCGFEFCWLCLGDWSKHQTSNFYRCNVYEQTAPDPNEEKRKKAKESLERYAHYFERYRAHSHGQRVAAEKQMAQVNKQMRVLLQRSLRNISEVEFLEDAVKQIVECRRILKWSYAFGYFANWHEAHQKHLFEYHQGQLERSLDLLQEKTETFDPEDFCRGGDGLLRLHVFKAELIDLTRVIGGFFRNICDVFEDEFCS